MSEARDRDMQAVAVSHDTVPATVDLLAEVQRLRAERDALQERVASYEADRDALVRIRDEFIATASHDLKSPLTTILSGAQLVQRLLEASVPDIGKAVKWTRTIQDQVRVMTLLINDLLDASRIHSGVFDLRLTTCEMNACVTTATKRLGPNLQARVTVSLAPNATQGQWDRQRIEQVLSNLLDNALKYSPNGERVAIVVETRAEEVEVSVIDRGMGMLPADLPRVFERFYRTGDATAGVVPGTGLGLYICEQIIAAHGGHLWVESAGPGEGARFRFTLPMSRPAVTPVPPAEEQAR
jgi:signal transduction histidine kinase